MVWAAVSIHSKISLYFYDNNEIIDQHKYADKCLTNFFNGFNNLKIKNKEQYWFQHDNARPHVTTKVQGCLREQFDNRFIGVDVAHPWPARFPDITICDCFLWGYLKHKVYAHKIENIEQLKQCIRLEVNKINRNKKLLKRVYQSLRSRIDDCISNNGQYLNY